MTCGEYRGLMRIGKKIEALRFQKGWTRKVLSHGMGITESQLSRIVKGESKPSWRSLAGLAWTFEITLGELLTGVTFGDEDLPKQHPLRQATADAVRAAAIIGED